MFERNEGVYRSSLLQREPWLTHGFGSRDAGGWPGEYLQVKQTHSNAVAFGREISENTKADGIVTDRAGDWIGVRTADCVPLVLADPVHKCVAVVHAGWRGTAADIAASAVRSLAARCGSSPGDLLAAIGPCIHRCCFNVGPEVAGQFQYLFPEAENLTHINLPEANRRQLIAAGLIPAKIDVAPLCTMCNAAEFHSFRRDRERSGRMVAAVRINAN